MKRNARVSYSRYGGGNTLSARNDYPGRRGNARYPFWAMMLMITLLLGLILWLVWQFNPTWFGFIG